MKKITSFAQEHSQLVKYLLLLGVLVAYFGYLSWHYGLASGGIVAALTWSFFVLCTPVADAGFLLDFPVRVITGLKMVFSEVMVWILAFTINISAVNFSPDAYQKTALTRLFYEILTTPWPYWSIIVLCSLGTFLSVIFGDKLLDIVGKKKNDEKISRRSWYKIAGIVVFFCLIVAVYYHLIANLGIENIIQGDG